MDKNKKYVYEVCLTYTWDEYHFDTYDDEGWCNFDGYTEYKHETTSLGLFATRELAEEFIVEEKKRFNYEEDEYNFDILTREIIFKIK